MEYTPKGMKYAREVLRKLVNIPSTSGYEEKIADYVLEELEEIHKIRPFEFAPKKDKKNNVYAVFGSGKDTLIINSHLDTVPESNNVGGIHEAYLKKSEDAEEWHFHGLGASDCKAGVASMLFLAKQLAEDCEEENKKGSILFLFTTMEEHKPEGEIGGSTYFSGNCPPELKKFQYSKGCIVCEPTIDGNAKIGYTPYILIGCRGRYCNLIEFKNKEDAVLFIRRMMVTPMRVGKYYGKEMPESIAAIRAEIGLNKRTRGRKIPTFVKIDYRMLPEPNAKMSLKTKVEETKNIIREKLLWAKGVKHEKLTIHTIDAKEISKVESRKEYLRLTLHGETGHTARPRQGKNALYRAIRVLDVLDRFGLELVSIETKVEKSGYNQIPDRCEVVLKGEKKNHGSFLEYITTEKFKKEFAMPDNKGKPRQINAKFNTNRRNWRIFKGYLLDTSAAPFVRRLRHATKVVWDVDAERSVALGASDAMEFFRWGKGKMPAVEFGPGMYYECHKPKEFAVLDPMYDWIWTMRYFLLKHFAQGKKDMTVDKYGKEVKGEKGKSVKSVKEIGGGSKFF